jgi:hypothetical protein
MRIYPDFKKVAAKLENIPAPLRSKELASVDARIKEMGIRHRRNGVDKEGNNYIECDIKPGTSPQQVHSFLEIVDAAAVDLEPTDVEALCGGKNPVSLGMRRYLEINGTQEVQRIEPDQITDALLSVRQKSWGSGDEVDETSDRFATDDLVMNGLLSQAEADSVDEFLEAKEQPLGLQTGDPARRYSELDMGEFTPDFEYESEWEGF